MITSPQLSEEADAQAPDIHPTAVIHSGATLEQGVRIGPFCVVGPHVRLGQDVELHSHVVIDGHTSIGEGTRVFPFASIGHAPQDVKYKGEPTQLEIGRHNIIREHVTMNPGTANGTGLTTVGDHGMFMVGSHVAHDCRVGDRVIFANNATLAGHCKVEDNAILGGLCAVHQHVRIGACAFIGGMSGVENDVIPFGMALGDRARLAGLNVVGMKRQGFDRDRIHTLRQAYRLMFSEEDTLSERLNDVEKMFGEDESVQRILAFARRPVMCTSMATER